MTKQSTEAELNAKIQANKELIARLHGHIQMLERRMAVVLTELKRERENPLPESAVIKPKVVLAESVLKIAPKNEGQAKATVRTRKHQQSSSTTIMWCGPK